MKHLACLSFIICHLSFSAAQPWSAQQCMQYAVAHNHDVRQSELALDNSKAGRLAAVGSFLPSVGASAGVQYNFGRAIDPETNTYTDVSTFYNGYSLSASMPVFDGFSRLHALKAARADVMMGKSALRVQQDQTALATLQAYADVCYYSGTVAMARERQQESALLLRQTRVLEEVGRKSAADVAQMEAQLAEADYELMRQQNMHSQALLGLKKEMNFPLDDSLSVSGDVEERGTRSEDSSIGGTEVRRCGGTRIVSRNEERGHPEAQQAYYRQQAARHAWHQQKAAFYPTLSVSAGMNTTYYKTLHSPNAETLSRQLRNNMGEYVAATLSVPLFNRLQTLTAVRRAKNNYLMAREAYEAKLTELQLLTIEAQQDLDAYVRQTAQMEKKVEADSLAYQLTRRQYEEGLSTAIDLHATSAQLLQSRATLLQCRLTTVLKACLVRYYAGESIWE